MRPDVLALALAAAACVALSGCATNSGAIKPEDTATKNEDAARIHTELGQKYMQQGKYELALAKLQKALSFDSDYVDAHTVIALLYERIGNLQQAEEHYRRAAELKPKGGAENNNYAAFLCKMNRFDEAQKHFDAALRDPFYQTPQVALTNAATCWLKAGNTDAAEKDLRLALSRSPNDAEALYQMARVLYEKKDYFRASAFVQRYESVGRPRPETLMLGRNIELGLGDAKGASDYSRRLQQLFPESAEARTLGGG